MDHRSAKEGAIDLASAALREPPQGRGNFKSAIWPIIALASLGLAVYAFLAPAPSQSKYSTALEAQLAMMQQKVATMEQVNRQLEQASQSLSLDVSALKRELETTKRALADATTATKTQSQKSQTRKPARKDQEDLMGPR